MPSFSLVATLIVAAGQPAPNGGHSGHAPGWWVAVVFALMVLVGVYMFMMRKRK